MGYGILHMKKIKGGSLSPLASHIYRTKGADGIYSNPDIDFARTKDNYIIYRRAGKLEAEVNTRINYALRLGEIARGKRVDPAHPELAKKNAVAYDAPVKTRPDAVRCIAYLVTASPEIMQTWPKEKQDEYFKRATIWLAKRYGQDNLMYAVVHRDEANPHLHLGLVPITEDNRLCANDLMTRSTLRAIQEDFWRDVAAQYGLHRGESTLLTHRRHLSEAEYKAKARAEEQETQNQKLDEELKAKKLKKEMLENSCVMEAARLDELKTQRVEEEQKIQALHPPKLHDMKAKIKNGHSKQRSWGAISTHDALTPEAWQSVNRVLDAMDGYVMQAQNATKSAKEIQATLDKLQAEHEITDRARLGLIRDVEQLKAETRTYFQATPEDKQTVDDWLNRRAHARAMQRHAVEQQRAEQQSRGGWTR